ncbi:MAG TPA: OmpA family protein [Gammaproteobacteria bacterium]
MGAQPVRKIFRTLAVASVVAAWPFANAAEPMPAEPTTALVPAFPAALDCAASDCPDTLHAAHDITFISRLSFPLGSALLTREAKGELLRMLVELESFAVIEHVEIVGHADPSGPENYNRWLSEKRAKRVQDYFAQRGVDPRKVTFRGVGSSEPLVGAIDPSEHRRIEVHITLHPFL